MANETWLEKKYVPGSQLGLAQQGAWEHDGEPVPLKSKYHAEDIPQDTPPPAPQGGMDTSPVARPKPSKPRAAKPDTPAREVGVDEFVGGAPDKNQWDHAMDAAKFLTERGPAEIKHLEDLKDRAAEAGHIPKLGEPQTYATHTPTPDGQSVVRTEVQGHPVSEADQYKAMYESQTRSASYLVKQGNHEAADTVLELARKSHAAYLVAHNQEMGEHLDRLHMLYASPKANPADIAAEVSAVYNKVNNNHNMHVEHDKDGVAYMVTEGSNGGASTQTPITREYLDEHKEALFKYANDMYRRREADVAGKEADTNHKNAAANHSNAEANAVPEKLKQEARKNDIAAFAAKSLDVYHRAAAAAQSQQGMSVREDRAAKKDLSERLMKAKSMWSSRTGPDGKPLTPDQMSELRRFIQVADPKTVVDAADAEGIKHPVFVGDVGSSGGGSDYQSQAAALLAARRNKQ